MAFDNTLPNVFVYRGIQFNYGERPNSPEFSYTANTPMARRVLDFEDWRNRLYIAAGIIGRPNPVLVHEFTDPTDNKPTKVYALHRELPMPYPEPVFSRAFGDTDIEPWMYATSVERVESVCPSNPWEVATPSGEKIPHHDVARMTVVYECLPYRVRPDADMITNGWGLEINGAVSLVHPDESAPAVDGTIAGGPDISYGRYINKIFHPVSDVLHLPIGRFYYVDNPPKANPDPTTAGVTKLNKYTEVAYIWHCVPMIPKAVRTHVGCVNHEPFDGYDAEELLLTAVELKPYRLIGGSKVYDITYRMRSFKPFFYDATQNKDVLAEGGHNAILRFHKATVTVAGVEVTFLTYKYQRISTTGKKLPDKAQYLFNLANFRRLFQLYV